MCNKSRDECKSVGENGSLKGYEFTISNKVIKEC